MKTLKEEFPLEIKIGFKKVFDHYQRVLDSDTSVSKVRAAEVMAIAKQYPILSEGLTSEQELKQYQPQIDILLDDMFAPVLGTNEIKTATIPMQELVFKATPRYTAILNAAGEGFKMELVNFNDDNSYIMACSIILNMYYGYNADFKRPFHYNIPDVNGRIRNYRVLYNADFITIDRTEAAKEITEADFLELLENFDDVEVWKEKFPPGGYISNGFIIANLYDATTDVSLSNFKASLLRNETNIKFNIDEFQNILQSIFNLPEIKIGFTSFNDEEGLFEQVPAKMNVNSYVLNGKETESCVNALCDKSYTALFQKKETYSISDVPHYYKLYPENKLYKKLYKQGIQSAIIAALYTGGKVLGLLEIVSPNRRDLNTVNASKLQDVLPFLIDSIHKTKKNEEDTIELLIQSECTSIHPSVHWKFRKEARRVLKSQNTKNILSFREVVFEDVYPLYGQIDIKGSSEARNEATKYDLVLQLKHVQKIIKKIFKLESLPIYEQIDFRIQTFLNELEEQFQVDSERYILNFLRSEIIPLYQHLSTKNADLKSLIAEYYKLVDNDKGFVYKHRKDYDESVMLINKKMAAILDKKQVEAQAMYPHYFERFKSDGVEHNLYIGESITKENSFNPIYLYNLRLWQLQVMCEMENEYYKLKENLSVPLDVASMILVFGSSLSLRFRMDEKRFDVDGTYNARYEVVKKRVDKANIKGTDERVTQAGKISIVYTQKEDEIEFLQYISFLQAKKQLDNAVEILELEDLQGVTGLKAIRVKVLYSKGKDSAKEYYTYEDLMDEISS
ncbi:GAF domain-containing protein [Ulvibacter litoralis]|uniref:GAF domain-containing protein n=1 Tax=Ulvibacter litoralis TaxID=227084 RepID=A0A1G7HLI4_9FLAO|nr:GAF domain-containing protein [Ulvibacter litoralis]GHC58298.1 hypothetical protein GCM10008083_23770 [Ulvibacter litoralis]SDF01330.1 hypothetical protein SAMN05421855_104166 [Ulvibacter litoralis]